MPATGSSTSSSLTSMSSRPASSPGPGGRACHGPCGHDRGRGNGRVSAGDDAALLAVLAVLELLTALRVGRPAGWRPAGRPAGCHPADGLLIACSLLTVLLAVPADGPAVAVLRPFAAGRRPRRPAGHRRPDPNGANGARRHRPDRVGGTGCAVVDRGELGVQRGLEAGERVVRGVVGVPGGRPAPGRPGRAGVARLRGARAARAGGSATPAAISRCDAAPGPGGVCPRQRPRWPGRGRPCASWRCP